MNGWIGGSPNLVPGSDVSPRLLTQTLRRKHLWECGLDSLVPGRPQDPSRSHLCFALSNRSPRFLP